MKIILARFVQLFTCFALAFVCLSNGADSAGSAYQAENPDKVLLSAAVVSDLHAADELKRDRNIILSKTFAGIAKSKTKPDALVMPGDLTNNGTRDEFRCLSAIIRRYNRSAAVIPATGNHDARGDMHKEDYAQSLGYYLTFCRLLGAETDRPYWFTKVNGYYFIVLGSEAEVKDRAYISDRQLLWLDGRLSAAETTGKPAFVICHQVIDHTNNVDNEWYFDGSIGEQSDAVRDVIRKHTDRGMTVLFISGHLHVPFCDFSLEQPWENLYCLNLPSAQYTNGGGEGCMLEVYEDRVLIRPRNFITGEWLPQTWTVPLG